jgi:hypothetical protein
MSLHSVVAVQGERKNGVPWFGHVVFIDIEEKKVVYLTPLDLSLL